jgi:8-oxo-dGTP pyrophosphatase MutT (NUDIX family)
VRRPHTRGVKCIVRDGDRILFVRHTYGDRRAWELPGGSLRRDERPDVAVRREMREELGVALGDLRPVGRVDVSGHGKETELFCFEARVARADVRLDPGELAEGRWAAADAPPQPLGPDAATLRRLVRAPPD